MIIALPMIAATVVLANPIMTLVAGEDFASSGPILAILIFAVGSIFLGTLYGYLVVVINKQKTMIASYIFVAVTALIAYFVLIPKFSYWAAAGITIYSEALIMLLAFYIVTKHTKVYPKMASTFKALIASLIMAIVLYFLISLNVLLLILIGMAVYLFIMFITKGLTKNMVMEIFKPVKIKNNE